MNVKLIMDISMDIDTDYMLKQEYNIDDLENKDLDKEVEYLFGEAKDFFIDDYLEKKNIGNKGRSGVFQLAKHEEVEKGVLDMFFVDENDDYIHLDDNSPELDDIFNILPSKVVTGIKKNYNKEEIIFDYKKYRKSINFVENFEEKIEKIIEGSKPYREGLLLYTFGADGDKHHHFGKVKEKIYVEITKDEDLYYDLDNTVDVHDYVKYASFYEDEEGFSKFERWFDSVLYDFDKKIQTVKKDISR